VAVWCLNKALCFYESLCLVDSEVLRNRHLRVAGNRYRQAKKNDSAENTARNLCNICGENFFCGE